MSDSTTPQDSAAMSPASVGSRGLDIIDRLVACETRPLVTMGEDSETLRRDAGAWVELWKTLQDARAEIAYLRRNRDQWAAKAMLALGQAGAAKITDAEREAIACGIDAIRDRFEGYEDCEPLQATLRSLLERTK